MDESYDPKHKASSITSTNSTSTNGTEPSLYSATSSTGSDLEDFGPLEGFDPTASLSVPAEDGCYNLYKQQQDQHLHQTACANSNAVLDTFLDLEFLESSTAPSRKRRTSDAGSTMTHSEQQPQDKRARELLTDEERRANHIASEQKRRNTIRTGFKDLTDIIPTLKNINNSKSTILFKAVEYIRHLEKRNRNLREKLASLQLRLEVESRLGRRHSLLPAMMTASNVLQQHRAVMPYSSSASSTPSSSRLAPETLAALMTHKKQQRQLELLQEQLQLQQKLLAKHNIAYPFTSHISIPSSSSNNNTTNSPFYSSRHKALDAPSVNIPADDDHYGSELTRHGSLLNCHHYQSSS